MAGTVACHVIEPLTQGGDLASSRTADVSRAVIIPMVHASQPRRAHAFDSTTERVTPLATDSIGSVSFLTAAPRQSRRLSHGEL